MSVRHEVRRHLWNLGWDIARFSPTSNPIARRKQLLRAYGVDLVLDVGANTGQFAQQLRHDYRYRGRIVSFEPMSAAFGKLKGHAAGDATWETLNFALGDAPGSQEINVANNSISSSLLSMLPTHRKFSPKSTTIGREQVEIRTLDEVFPSLRKDAKSVYLKIDTQGFESLVIAGARESLKEIATVQMEMSLIHLYDGEILFAEMCQLMQSKGYTLVAIETGFSDRVTGQLLQVDGIFHRFEGGQQATH
jgi:FkbM family methyltransferase